MASKTQLIKDALSELTKIEMDNDELIQYIIDDWIDSLTEDELLGLNDTFTDLVYPHKDKFEALFS
tara:strand:+ start:583 stop:780 length:198 start_codon:yes stop_codon:yes gene_type:complete